MSSSSPPRHRRARALHGVLLALTFAHPRARRRRFAHELVEVLQQRLLDAERSRGRRAATRLLLREATGLVVAGLRARWGRDRIRTAPPRSRRSSTSGGIGMPALWNDLRIALRGLLRRPAFCAVAVGALALGIGANVAIFSVFYAVLLRPLPFEEPSRLVLLWEKNPDRNWHQAQVAAANFLDWQAQAETFAGMAAYNDWLEEKVTLVDGEPQVVWASEVTGELFRVLGVDAVLGRGFDAAHDWATAPPAAVLSFDFWQRRFGGARDILGKTLELDGASYTVIGVMPRALRFPFPETEVWLPVAWQPAFRDEVWFRRAHGMRVVARLGAGVSLREAENELATIASRLESTYPETNTRMGTGVTPLREWISGDARRPLGILLTAVGLVLLIACTNVANLLLARGAARRREMAVRGALGGSRSRLVWLGLVESLVLATAGGALGLWLGALAIEPLLSLDEELLRRAGVSLDAVTLDASVVAFCCGLVLLSVVLCGAVPAWRGASRDAAETLRGGHAAARQGLAGWLVAAEVALALPLAIGAGLMARTLWHLGAVDPGFVAADTLIARLSLPGGRFDEDAEISAFYRRLVDEVNQLPGVREAALSSRLPFGNARWSSSFTAAGWPAERSVASVRHDEISPGLFRTMGVPLLRGRDFDLHDDLDGAAVVIVNQALADQYFPGEDPLGQRVTFDRVPEPGSVWRTIVGVVGNVRRESLALEEEPSFYAPMLQDVTRGAHLLVRTEGDPLAMRSAVEDAVRRLDPALPLFEVTTLEEVVAASAARERLLVVLLAGLAGVAAALAAIGTFGVLSDSVARRRRELGIRLAVGASRAAVFLQVLRHGLLPALAGLAAGLVLATTGTAALRGMLFEVEPLDPLTFAAAAAALLLVSVLACCGPARWATRVDPTQALRIE